MAAPEHGTCARRTHDQLQDRRGPERQEEPGAEHGVSVDPGVMEPSCDQVPQGDHRTGTNNHDQSHRLRYECGAGQPRTLGQHDHGQRRQGGGDSQKAQPLCARGLRLRGGPPDLGDAEDDQ